MITAVIVMMMASLASGLVFTPEAPWERLVMTGFPVAFILLGMVFQIRGYELSADELIIRRLGWVTRISLRLLKQVEVGREHLSGSIRLFGNGGFFTFAGWFWNSRLGRYRLLANDPRLAVVLRFADRRVVIAPHDPAGFVEAIRGLRPEVNLPPTTETTSPSRAHG